MNKYIKLEWNDETVEELGIKASFLLTQVQKTKRWDDDRYKQIMEWKKAGKNTNEIAQLLNITTARLLEKLRSRRSYLICQATRNFREVMELGGKKSDFEYWFNKNTSSKEHKEVVDWVLEMMQ